MGNVIKVDMADLKLCKSPDSITTLGLGSCVGIAIRDPVTKVGGLAHIMLPDSTQIRNTSNIAKFADTGITELVRIIVAAGGSRSRLVAKIAGGAQMFTFQNQKSEMIRVGERNVEATKAKLRQLRIPVLAEDTGLNYGRTVIFFPETGDFVIKSVGKPQKTI
ncbi:chemotaxis protein CheD [bacterium C-53]|nr:chemotaxis protein CheD [Lachnospiraceae bacterium]NBI02138.1 chemotaxis protein CheD [Lachnospiraceae bacterium]RKJ10397.1 chemotaxis protein CheD [bacterium C-53]